MIREPNNSEKKSEPNNSEKKVEPNRDVQPSLM